MSERPTPETDKQYPDYRAGAYDRMAEHARKLERQRDEAREQLEAFNSIPALRAHILRTMSHEDIMRLVGNGAQEVLHASKAAVNTLKRDNERLRDALSTAQLTIALLNQDIDTIREICIKGGTNTAVLMFLNSKIPEES